MKTAVQAKVDFEAAVFALNFYRVRSVSEKKKISWEPSTREDFFSEAGYQQHLLRNERVLHYAKAANLPCIDNDEANAYVYARAHGRISVDDLPLGFIVNAVIHHLEILEQQKKTDIENPSELKPLIAAIKAISRAWGLPEVKSPTEIFSSAEHNIALLAKGYQNNLRNNKLPPVSDKESQEWAQAAFGRLKDVVGTLYRDMRELQKPSPSRSVN